MPYCMLVSGPRFVGHAVGAKAIDFATLGARTGEGRTREGPMPSWVMVPVPDEHVQEVMEFVIRTITRANVEDWDAPAVEEYFREADEATRGLLSMVSRATVSGKDLTDQKAADFLQLNLRETLGIMREINDNVRAAGRPFLIASGTLEEELPNGRVREVRILTMPPTLAKWVRDAERNTDALESARRPGLRRLELMAAPAHAAPEAYSDDVFVFEPGRSLAPGTPRVRRRRLEAPALHRGTGAQPTSAARTSNQLLGQLWAVLDPLMQAAIYWILVTLIRGSRDGELSAAQTAALIIGCVFLFSQFRVAFGEGSRELIKRKGLILNSTFPMAMFPLTAMYRGILEFVPMIGVYAVFHVLAGMPFGPGLFVLPLLFALQLADELRHLSPHDDGDRVRQGHGERHQLRPAHLVLHDADHLSGIGAERRPGRPASDHLAEPAVPAVRGVPDDPVGRRAHVRPGLRDRGVDRVLSRRRLPGVRDA